MDVTDIHLSVGTFPRVRRLGELTQLDDFGKLSPDHTFELIKQCIDDRNLHMLLDMGESDFSFSRENLGRYRANAFKQRGSYALVIRIQPFKIPDFQDLNLPPVIKEFTNYQSGLVLVTGVTGSGKSTTLASLIDIINKRDAKHIITIEDPIEYLYRHKKSIVNQREMGIDSNNFATALRASLREDPDVILVGEMRDLETTRIAITAAETGHLVFSTMHTVSSAQTVERIIDIFPHEQQNQIRSQLATVLRGVVTQQLIPRQDSTGMVATCEVLKNNSAVSNLIRENKVYQIQNVIQTNVMDGMQTMNQHLVELYKQGTISRRAMTSHTYDLNELHVMLARH